MFRIRFHGRGGQGMKTASRILGTAFSLQGYEVQDAPRYGAERRGAPVFAYVRASKNRINERGIIRTPDLVAVADDSLFKVCPAQLAEGVTPQTVIIVNTTSETSKLHSVIPRGRIITIPRTEDRNPATPGTLCAAAAARLTGVISRESFINAMTGELAGLDAPGLDAGIQSGLDVFDAMEGHASTVSESADIQAGPFRRVEWIDLPLHDTGRSAPAIHRSRTSVLNPTGTWRTERPSIKPEDCSRCMLCALYCPDSVISADASGRPVIDYDHCKGCMVCMSVCPAHAVSRMPEHAIPEATP